MFKWLKSGLARAASPDEGDRNILFRIAHSEYKWRKTRKAHIRFQPCCMCCGRTKKLQVHHIEPWAQFPAGRYDTYNLVTMCDACHFRYGHFQNWRDKNPGILDLIIEMQEWFKRHDRDYWEKVTLTPYQYPTVSRQAPAPTTPPR